MSRRFWARLLARVRQSSRLDSRLQAAFITGLDSAAATLAQAAWRSVLTMPVRTRDHRGTCQLGAATPELDSESPAPAAALYPLGCEVSFARRIAERLPIKSSVA